ncbi:uncharacterized protein F4822DRAFT_150565 [Hypoxylon trugodes]|uniref:uncharacterized protein n=1 Tax=Hypoxylon trugodes TaxID=326681 RepID=UPI0021926A39|nr:uncharacterized protein F4822DRAFT_150565 [Hypoxylon trugodes]KAI1382566.1 hypothetical protein F4822DRAFT_150565 [Hypoxylon trugodes]
MAPWLRLAITSTVPHQLYSEEFCSAYSSIDTLKDGVPGIIHMIGNTSKKKILHNLSVDNEENDAINLHQARIQERPILIIDSAWPPKPLRRVGVADGSKFHWIQNGNSVPTSFDSTIKLFSRLLGIISQTVVIFVDDFSDFSSVFELLSPWIRFSCLDIRYRPRLLLISNAFNKKGDPQLFFDRLLRYLTKLQHIIDPTKPHTKADSIEMCQKCFESIQLIPDYPGVTNLIFKHNEDMIARRLASKWVFSASHLQRIIKSAIIHFSLRRTETFNIVLAFRGCDSKKSYKDHIEGL